MTKTIRWAFSLLLLCSLASCIQDEPLNAECDITAVSADWVEAHRDMLIGKPILTNDHVTFNIQKGSDRSQLNPRFELTEGARITCTLDGQEVEANGIVRNFSTPQTYTVHSQDGHWHKSYTVAFDFPHTLDTLHFEHYELESTGRYYVWYEYDPTDITNAKRYCWASGNAGFALTGMGKEPLAFPTAPAAGGKQGACVQLVTRSTGSFGLAVGKPIAAGNIYIGTFSPMNAVRDPLRATQFGQQLVSGRPKAFEGYYRYTPGEVFTDVKGQVCPDRRDKAAIYAVVYEVDPDKFEALDGSNVTSSERVVMLARVEEPGEPAEWTRFSVPFRLVEGKEFSEERLRRDGYALAIVASSSEGGDYFEGAVGSTLFIDEFVLLWE